MANTFAEYIAKVQEDSLALIKQTQEASLQSLTAMRDMISKNTNIEANPAFANVPSIKAVVDANLEYANKLYELRKQYTEQLADLAVKMQQDTTNVAMKATEAMIKAGDPSRSTTTTV